MKTRQLHQLILAAVACASAAMGQADGSFQVRYASNLTAKVASTIYSTDGVPPAFSPFFYGIQTAPAPGCAVSSYAMQFTAGVTGPLQQITLPVFLLAGRHNRDV
jgi:hypothetical protein